MALDVKQQAAIEVLASGGKQADAARAAGVNRSTIMRWVAKPEFAEALTRAAEAHKVEATTGLAELVPKALKAIEEALAGNLPASAGNVALGVIKTAALVDKTTLESESSLEARLAELDSRNAGKSD